MAKKLIDPKTKAVTKVETKAVTKEVEVLERAKELFIQMQRNWWDFAKAVYEIRESEFYKHGGHETFRDYCEHEFPQTNFKTILKFCSIVENWGKSIESKLEKDENWQLPAYEACYTVVSMKDGAMAKEEVDKLKRDVLEKKLSYHKLRDKIKELLDSKRKEVKEFVKKSGDEIKQLEKDLENQISEEEIGDMAFTEDEEESEIDFEAPEADLEDLEPSDFEDDSDVLIAKTEKCAKDLSEMLTLFGDKLPDMSMTKKLQKLATTLDSLKSSLDDLLTEIEEKA